MRLGLEIHRTVDLSVSRRRQRLFLYRLWTRVRFKSTMGGWGDDHVAIVDTGAPYSVIPLSLQPAMRVQKLVELPLRGIIPGKTAELDAVLAKISGRLLDPKRLSPPLTLWAMLATTDQVPLILGWAGCLDHAKLVVDAPRSQAWLEF